MKLDIGVNDWYQGEPFTAEDVKIRLVGPKDDAFMIVEFPIHIFQKRMKELGKGDLIYDNQELHDNLKLNFEYLGIDEKVSGKFDWSEHGLQTQEDNLNYCHFDMDFELAKEIQDCLENYDPSIIDLDFD